MEKWYKNASIYHMYPLGIVGFDKNTDNHENIIKTSKIEEYIPHIKHMGYNTILLGPIFESISHGYDITDYLKVDSRLGTNADYKKLIYKLKRNNINVILDIAFNHVGREHEFFRDLLAKGENSEYVSWFRGVDFNNKSPYNDNFTYDAWDGNYNLVRWNLANDKTVKYLLDIAGKLIKEFNIDGFRLDCADSLAEDFIVELKKYTSNLKEDFFLLGEIVNGDYNKILGDEKLDSVTNYECYKGIYSSHNDKNLCEIGFSLNRQFNSNDGVYKFRPMYNFLDNHDVSRIATSLRDNRDLYTANIILYTMPGISSNYYGSEFGVKALKIEGSDENLRPKINIIDEMTNNDNLMFHIRLLNSIRMNSLALRLGEYEEVICTNTLLIYKRSYLDEVIYVVINIGEARENIEITNVNGDIAIDLLNNNFVNISNNKMNTYVDAHWGRIIRVYKSTK